MLAGGPELLRDGDVGPARLQVARGVVVGDDHASGVDEQREPEHLTGAGDARVDRPDVADVGADHAVGRRERDGEEDLAVLAPHELAAESYGVGRRPDLGRYVAPLANRTQPKHRDGEPSDMEAWGCVYKEELCGKMTGTMTPHRCVEHRPKMAWHDGSAVDIEVLNEGPGFGDSYSSLLTDAPPLLV